MDTEWAIINSDYQNAYSIMHYLYTLTARWSCFPRVQRCPLLFLEMSFFRSSSFTLLVFDMRGLKTSCCSGLSASLRSLCLSFHLLCLHQACVVTYGRWRRAGNLLAFCHFTLLLPLTDTGLRTHTYTLPILYATHRDDAVRFHCMRRKLFANSLVLTFSWTNPSHFIS